MGPDTNWAGILQTLFLFLFTAFILIGAITTTNRLRRYLKRGETPPKILWRDVIARNSLAFPFIAIFAVRAARAFGVDVDWLVLSVWWVIGTSVPPVFGAAVYVWFELFIIEADGGGEYANGNGHSP